MVSSGCDNGQGGEGPNDGTSLFVEGCPEPGNASEMHRSGDESPLNISIRSSRPEFEVNQRTGHTLVIKNQSSQVVTLPSFRFLNLKQEDPEIGFYLREQIPDLLTYPS